MHPYQHKRHNDWFTADGFIDYLADVPECSTTTTTACKDVGFSSSVTNHMSATGPESHAMTWF